MGIAWLGGYELKFHKRSRDGSAKCNALPSSRGRAEVIGVLFRIRAEEKSALDRAEGLRHGYHQEDGIEVLTEQGTVPCCMYLADDNAIDNTLKPYDWYKAYVVAGAKEHGLPPGYRARLEAVGAIPDPDGDRAARERAILRKARSGKL